MLSAAILGLAASPILIRFGQADITPPEPLALGGYTARKGTQGVVGDEKLYARCVMLEQGDGKPVFLVSIDLLTAPESLVEAVKAKVPTGELVLAATHTHSAPDSQMLNKRMNFAVPGIATFSQRWLDWYADKIASACTEAVRMKPLLASELGYRVAEVDANRGRREGAEPIKSALLMEASNRVPLFACYAAHATIFEEGSVKVSGDWPGAWAAKLNCPTLVGAIGDVSPAADGSTPEEKIKAMVEKLQGGLEKSPFNLIPGEKLFLRFSRSSIPLGEAVPHPQFAKSFGAPDALAGMVVKKFAPEAAEVTALAVGNVAVVGVPAELSSSLARQVMDAGRKAGFAHTVVVSHVNGWIGYVLDPEDYDRGGYEATLSFHGREIGVRVVEAAKKAISDLATSRPSLSTADNSRQTPQFEAA